MCVFVDRKYSFGTPISIVLRFSRVYFSRGRTMRSSVFFLAAITSLLDEAASPRGGAGWVGKVVHVSYI